MSRHYFLTTLLPSLRIGQMPELGSVELEFYLQQNLSREELKTVQVLRRLIDLDNIRLFLQNEPLSPGGNYTEKELEEHLLHHEELPFYVLNYFEQYTNRKDRLKHFARLYHHFFQAETCNHKGFAHSYLSFERQWRLVFTAMRAEALGRDFKKEFIDEDPDDEFIQQIMQQQTSFDPPEPYKELKVFFTKYKDTPFDLYQALAEWRFRAIEAMVGWHTFYIDRVLAYIVQLNICEKWLELDQQQGLHIIETTVKGVS